MPKKKKKDWFEFDIYSETSVLRVTSFSQEKKTLTNNDHLHRWSLWNKSIKTWNVKWYHRKVYDKPKLSFWKKVKPSFLKISIDMLISSLVAIQGFTISVPVLILPLFRQLLLRNGKILSTCLFWNERTQRADSRLQQESLMTNSLNVYKWIEFVSQAFNFAENW